MTTVPSAPAPARALDELSQRRTLAELDRIADRALELAAELHHLAARHHALQWTVTWAAEEGECQPEPSRRAIAAFVALARAADYGCDGPLPEG